MHHRFTLFSLLRHPKVSTGYVMAHTDAIHAVYQDPIALVELIERRKWARMFWTNPTDDVCRRGHDGHAKGWKRQEAQCHFCV